MSKNRLVDVTMGQKINPVGLRAKLVNRSGGWYAPLSSKLKLSSDYADKLHIDFALRQAVQSLANSLDLVQVKVFLTQSNRLILTLFLPYPDYLYMNLSPRVHPTITQTFKISHASNLKESLKTLLEWPRNLQVRLRARKIFLSQPVSVQIKLVKASYHRPDFLATAIQASLQKRVAIRRAVKLWAQTALNQKVGSFRVQGVRVRLSGRLNNAEMASSEQLSFGKVSLHTISAPVDYCCRHYRTSSGVLGIKVWVARY